MNDRQTAISFLQKRICSYLFISLLPLTATLNADNKETLQRENGEDKIPSGLFLQVRSGYAWSSQVTIRNATVANDWDFANQGYNANLTNATFTEFAIGGYPLNFLNLNISYAYYDTIHYQKYQTGTSGTPGFTGSARMRYFNFDHQNVLFNGVLSLPGDYIFSSCNYVTFSPFVGGGIGPGFYQVNNFDTVGFDNNVGSSTSLGINNTNASFAWQVNAGFTILSCDGHLSFDLGYNYYSGGTFKTPNVLMVNTSSFAGALDAAVPWEGTFNANELFFAFRFTF